MIDYNITGDLSSQTYDVNIEVKPTNGPPTFVDDISALRRVTLTPTQETQTLDLGLVTDSEGNRIEVVFNDEGHEFIEFDEGEMAIDIRTADQRSGSYSVTLTLNEYENSALLSSTDYDFQISIEADESPGMYI